MGVTMEEMKAQQAAAQAAWMRSIQGIHPRKLSNPVPVGGSRAWKVEALKPNMGAALLARELHGEDLYAYRRRQMEARRSPRGR